MKSKFDLLELYFQKIIESSADILWHDERINLVRNLIDAIETEMDPESDGNEDLPSAFTIYLPLRKYVLWHSDKDWIDRFSIALQEAAVEMGLHIGNRPVISLEIMPDLADDEIRVHILRSEQTATKTAIIAAENPDDNPRESDSRVNAFLIMEDGTHFPLDKNVINIGRREENELVIDDPHVSREHAQIRLVKNTFFLFDLNSTAGTYVNGRKIDQYTLQPGDVISVSDHPIIYVREDFSEENSPKQQENITHTTRINTGKKEENKAE